MASRRATLRPELIVQALYLPKETVILDAKTVGPYVDFLIESPGLKALPDEQNPPLVTPHFRKQDPVAFITWGQE